MKDKIKSFLSAVAKAENPNLLTPKMVDFVANCLMFLYERQTVSEQATESTHLTNNVGFNHADAKRLTSVAKWKQQKGFITPKQAKMVARRLVKYAGQLEQMAK